jgi:hypothetical protein
MTSGHCKKQIPVCYHNGSNLMLLGLVQKPPWRNSWACRDLHWNKILIRNNFNMIVLCFSSFSVPFSSEYRAKSEYKCCQETLWKCDIVHISGNNGKKKINNTNWRWLSSGMYYLLSTLVDNDWRFRGASMEAVNTSDTSVSIYQIMKCHIPHNSHIHTHCRENLKSHPTNKNIIHKEIRSRLNF